MDLITIVFINLLVVPLIYSVSIMPIRILLGLVIVLFCPGYTLIAVLFPRRGQLEGVERFAFSVGLSLAVVPLLGLILNFSPWGIRLTPIVLILDAWNIALATTALYRRRRLLPTERAEIHWEPLATWIRERGAVYLAALGLSSFLLLALAGVIVWRIQNSPAEAFTEFYVLGQAGKIQDYTTKLRVGEAQSYTLGIVNNEKETQVYTIRVSLGGIQVGLVGPQELKRTDKWEGQVSITPLTAGAQQNLEFRLHRRDDQAIYRSLNLWVDVR